MLFLFVSAVRKQWESDMKTAFSAWTFEFVREEKIKYSIAKSTAAEKFGFLLPVTDSVGMAIIS